VSTVIVSEVSISEWEEFLKPLPEVHLLQTSGWGTLKQAFGWEAKYILGQSEFFGRLGALILFRRLPLGLRIAYIPKGPVGWQATQTGVDAGWGYFLNVVDAVCRQMHTIFLILEPDLRIDVFASPPSGFQPGIQSIQPPRTILVDLTGGEDQVLARMKQKTRYNIRLSQKRGVIAHPSQDLEAFYHLVLTTGERDGFGVHSLAYYQKAYQIFHSRGECELFLAESEGAPLAGLMVFARGARAWYFYGASSDQQRELMPTYLVQWEAMRWAMRHGCTEYDLWGVPDAEDDYLEANFTHRSDGLWGVYRYKRGFGGSVYRSAGPFERIYQPALYRVYRTWFMRSGRAAE
jgi:peptidoglycan pentaglycine glycine transferase (the first glycine)